MSIFDAEIDPLSLSVVATPGSTSGQATDVELIEAVFKDFIANEKQNSRGIMLADEWQPVVEDIEETTGVVFPNPARGYRNYDLASARIFKYIKENSQELPHLQGLTHEQLEKTAILNAKAARENLEALSATRPDNPVLPGLLGSMGAVMTEPAVLATVPASFAVGGGGLLKLMLTEAVLAAGSEAAIQIEVSDWYNSLGYDYDFEDFVSRVGIAGVAGGGLAGLLYGAGKAVSFTTDQAKRGLDAYSKAGLRKKTPADDALEKEISNIEQDVDARPIEDTDEHHIRLQKARQAVANADISQLPREADMPVYPESPVRDVPREIVGGYLFEVKPDQIQVDAKLFQFKQGGDALGVTERLQSVEKWDPELAGEIMVYEYADGRMFITDGHQRLALAKRLQEQEPSQDIKMVARVHREVDGITPEQARIRAAVKNLAQGTGTEIDAAKVFKGDIKVDFKTLPVGNKLIANGMGIMKLSDDAFTAVINGMIPPNHAAIIGRVLGNKPELHPAAVDIIAKTKPANEFEAEAIIRQIEAAPTMEATQGGLFGDEIVTNSLFKERAKVLDLARKRLLRDKSTFNTLVDNANRIESEGNQLSKDRNLKRRDADVQAIQLIQALANTKGPIADALNRSAKVAAETGKFDDAVTDFVAAIRTGIDSGDLGRLSSGDIRYDFNAVSQERAAQAGPEIRLDDYDQPGGAGAQNQGDQLEQDMFGGMDEPTPEAPATPKEPTPDQAARQLTEEEQLIEEIPLDEPIPVQTILDGDDEAVVTKTMREIKEDLDEEQRFLDIVGGCIK